MNQEDGNDRTRRKSDRDKNNAHTAALYEVFKVKFPTPESGLNELCRKFHQRLLICRNRECAAKLPEDCAVRNVCCPKCGRVNWITAGTFLDHMRKPLAWLAAIWLQEQGVILSSTGFAKLVGVCPSTCLNILQTTGFVILNSVDDHKAEIYGTEAFIDRYCKRSTDTPRGEHPSAEQKAMEIENGIREREPEEDSLFDSAAGIIDFFPAEQGPEEGPDEESAQEPAEEPAEETAAADEELVAESEEEPCESAVGNSLGEHEDGTLDATPDEPEEFDVSGPLTKIENELLDLIGKEGINFDLLCDRTDHPTGTVSAVCTMLELKGFVAQQIGNRYVPVDKITPAVGTKFEHKRPFSTAGSTNLQTTSIPPVKPGVRIELSQLQQQVAKDFMEYLRTYHHGISRKHVQLYFVRFWYYKSRERLPERWLSDACLKFAEYLEKGVGSYRSPLRIKIPPLLTQ